MLVIEAKYSANIKMIGIKDASLGVDIGTTSTKLVVAGIKNLNQCDGSSNSAVAQRDGTAQNSIFIDFNAEQKYQQPKISEDSFTSENLDTRNEQCPQSIISALASCIDKAMANYSNQLKDSLQKISICGQMHGVILWCRG
ncbi:hypothetical protein EB796_005126 [Bugula neritina]|uniref:Uncharacterized protein n=1 Tax=Bugula neritina TaxID=10212 RepID=A0A7J7KD33_BUGNE|nr:hypothetical protein EB796_005126 [Bugula neritina]